MIKKTEDKKLKQLKKNKENCYLKKQRMKKSKTILKNENKLRKKIS